MEPVPGRNWLKPVWYGAAGPGTGNVLPFSNLFSSDLSAAVIISFSLALVMPA